MEKLIELLSESTNGRFKTEQDLRLCIEMRWYCRNFIKWLIDNNKIDLDEIERCSIFWYTYYQNLLMLLSISNTPIDDLISYLR